MTADWETKAAARRQQLAAKIPEEWRLGQGLLDELKRPAEEHDNDVISLGLCARSGILSARELEITEAYGVGELLRRLAGGELTASEVALAYCKRAAIAQQLTNCCAEIFFEKALQRARELDDAFRERGGKPLGPLHGLPVSLKDNIQVSGVGASIGLVAFMDDVSESNSAAVDILLANGAVIYCKTNVPQTMLTVDTDNNIFGRTLNPHNTSLSAGGSSGGEGALIGFRGSPLGMGNDVGGSIRYPAACCGIYGFRPTVGRIPSGDLKGCIDRGMAQIKACMGPMAYDIDALRILMKVVIDARPWTLDATALDIPWRDDVKAGQKLRIGVMAEDPICPLQPPVRAAVREAVAALTAAGHETVQLEPAECDFFGTLMVTLGFFSLDQTAKRIVNDAGEPLIPSRVAIDALIDLVQSPSSAETKRQPQGLPLLSALNLKRAAVAERWHDNFTSHRLDAVIGPIMQHTAAEHDKFSGPAYGTIFNLLDYPACVIPFGKASTKDDGEAFEVKPGQLVAEYNAAKSEGMPRSIQIVTPTFRDEECLAIAKVVDTCLNGTVDR